MRFNRLPQRVVTSGLIFGAWYSIHFSQGIYIQASSMKKTSCPCGEYSDINDTECSKMSHVAERYKVIADESELFWKNPSYTKAFSQIYYLSYLVSLFPAGIAADTRCGPKILIEIALCISFIATCLLPVFISSAPVPLLVIRLAHGMCMGIVDPAVLAMIARWVPARERAATTAILLSAQFAGMFSPFIITRMIDENICFYLAAIVAVLMCFIWHFKAYRSPVTCPHISDSEREMVVNGTVGMDHEASKRRPRSIPFKRFLSSGPVMALLLLVFSNSIQRRLMRDYFGKYFHAVLGRTNNVSNNIKSLADGSIVCPIIVWGFLSDWLVNNDKLHRTTSRKLLAFLGSSMTIPCIIEMMTVGCDWLIVVALYTALSFFRGSYQLLVPLNIVDLTPNNSGMLVAVIYLPSAAAGLFTEYYYSSFVDENGDSRKEWQMMLIPLMILEFFCSILYLRYSSGEIQPWNSL